MQEIIFRILAYGQIRMQKSYEKHIQELQVEAYRLRTIMRDIQMKTEDPEIHQLTVDALR